MRILLLATDAFGGRGGIARYVRDLSSALAKHRRVDEVVLVPRHLPDAPEEMPENVRFVRQAARGKVPYTTAVAHELLRAPTFDLVWAAHINLLWLARLASLISGGNLVLSLHGIEAWNRPGRMIRLALRGVDHLVAISRHTLNRFDQWAGGEQPRSLLPGAIRSRQFGPGPKSRELLQRYGLDGRRVLLTLGRLEARERYKGFDEVVEVLPSLPPDVTYLIVGEGSDQQRLELLAREKGVGERVVFAGYVPEAEKADHFRLADVYVMPSSGEGFGFVFLEALACGVPVIASRNDGGREAVLDGKMGLLVNPDDPAELRNAILEALSRPRRVPDELNWFSFDNFVQRCHKIVDEVLGTESRA